MTSLEFASVMTSEELRMPNLWSPSDYTIEVSHHSTAESVSESAYSLACRSDFSRPGFCLIDLGSDVTSTRLRSWMFDVKQGLQRQHQSRVGRDIVYLSAGRFDQQTTTKPHRDGAPDESCLMLGYEPSQVQSEISLLDYSRCALEMQVTPGEFLIRHNPMFEDVDRLLGPFSTQIAAFDNQRSYILLINNSMSALDRSYLSWQGVLHTATIPNPSEELSRIINSTMLASVDMGTPEPLSSTDLKEFLTTAAVRHSGYMTSTTPSP